MNLLAIQKSVLREDNRVESDLWIDQKNALVSLAEKFEKKEFENESYNHLKDLIEKGYCILDLALNEEFVINFEKSIQQLWKEKPSNVLAAKGGEKPISFSNLSDITEASPGVRLIDIHSFADEFTSLYLNEKVHNLLEIVYEEKAVATQSLYFEFGSQQSLHRDPWFVVTKPPSNMLAVWIALEDISPDSGPLSFVPGSHQLPYTRFSTDNIIFHDPKVSNLEREKAYQIMNQQIIDNNLSVKKFIAKRGQALIWHSGLIHGGSPVSNPKLTRKSYVVHFDKISGRNEQKQRIYHIDGSSEVFATRTLLYSNGCYGFDSPVRTKL